MEEELLVVTFIDAENTQRILDKCFDIAPCGTVAFHNNYFDISVNLRVMFSPEADGTLCDESGELDLAKFPAIVLLSSSEPDTISRCQKVWESMHGTVCEDTVRILFLEGDNLDENETYEIVSWGLRMRIEVVNSLLCKEDEIDIPVRLKRTLECSPWPSISRDECQRKTASQESQRKNTAKGEVREASNDEFNLSKPTSLRRGLHGSDVTRLVDDLVLADDSDSDD